MTPARALSIALLCAAALDTRADSDLHDDDVQLLQNISFNITGPKLNEIDDVFKVHRWSFDGTLQDVGEDIIYDLTDEEYYAMPTLFHLDEYFGCLATGGAYCMGSFELLPTGESPLFRTMQRYSANWVDNYNHTRLHRGLCLPRSCAPPDSQKHTLETWFVSCVNTTTMSSYNLSAQLYRLDYCSQGPARSPPLTTSERAFAALVTALLVLATISTVLDSRLSDTIKKEYSWALSWSLRRSWSSLTASAPTSHGADLCCFDGLRFFCMMNVIIEHVCWLGTLSYISNTRYFEQVRRDADVMLMTNSTLMVQVFFLMASFLLAHKLLREEQPKPMKNTFFSTIINRIIRISPSYYIVLWFASSWWERLGDGPQWISLVGSEAAVCRKKWWTHLLYLNNVLYPDEKCLIQTWYLAADMQLYAAALLLTLLLRGRHNALTVLAGLFAAATVIPLVLAYAWHLVPTFVLHRPESVRLVYDGDASFTWLYQSPLGNAAGALAGLLLAHLQYKLRSGPPIKFEEYKIFRWVSTNAAPTAFMWVMLSPLMLGTGPPHRLAAAALAALERPIFITLVAVALLGAMNGIDSAWRRLMSQGATVLARLSFGALLLHMVLNKTTVATRIAPIQLDRQSAINDWFGVAVVSYAAALPLALLVELPVQQLYKELKLLRSKSKSVSTQPPTSKPSSKSPTSK